MKKGLFGFNVHDMVEIAIICAFSIILDKSLKIPVNGAAGSINLSMLPILILTLRHGWFKGFFAGGIIFGIIESAFAVDVVSALYCICDGRFKSERSTIGVFRNESLFLQFSIAVSMSGFDAKSNLNWSVIPRQRSFAVSGLSCNIASVIAVGIVENKYPISNGFGTRRILLLPI